jgi:SAM-dependent methyltransferase
MRNQLPSKKHTRNDILDALKSISIDGSIPGEMAGYIQQDFDRFLITLNLLPKNIGRNILEIGSNPYFLTILLKWFRPELQLELINFFGSSGGHHIQSVQLNTQACEKLNLAPKFDMPFTSVNCETDIFPYANESLDCVIFCEVLEHFISDPCHALMQIARVIKPSGYILLSTPNVARLENIAKMLNGSNVFDSYSGHGPYGRHNREYTRHEVAWLLTNLGFEAIDHFTADVYANQATIDTKKLPLIRGREHDFGQYQFHLWKKVSAPKSKLRPSWLYRSMAEAVDTKPL